MRSSAEPDTVMCPFLRSVRQTQSGQSSESFVNACYLQRRPTRGNLIRSLHTQANLCISGNHSVCPHYRVATCAGRKRSKVPARA